MHQVNVDVVRVSMSTEENKQPDFVTLRRDVDARLVPSGARIFLQAGTEVRITQSLGGSYTVSIYGNLARIEAADADALGLESEASIPESALEENTALIKLSKNIVLFFNYGPFFKEIESSQLCGKLNPK